MIAAENEHFQIVKYLIEQCEADPNIADSGGYNALHLAAFDIKSLFYYTTTIIMYCR